MATRLSLNDDLVSSCIDQLYQASLDGSLWPAALDQLARVSGGAGMVLLPLDADPALSAMAYVPPNMTEVAGAYALEWVTRCPRRRAIHRYGLQDSVISDGDLFTGDELGRSGFHHDLLRAFDCGDMLSRNSTQIQPGASYGICSQRAAGSPPPTQDERRLFANLSLHLVRALQVYRRLEAPANANAALVGVLDRLGCGALIVDADRRVLYANVVAERLAGDGFRIAQGRLLAEARGEQARLDRMVEVALQPGSDEPRTLPIVLSRPSGRRPLMFQAIRLAASAEVPLWPLLNDLGVALVLAVDPESETPAPASAVAALRLYGLTQMEAEVASLLGGGCSPQQISERQGVRTTTVRSHISRIYSKLDICRQGELARLVQGLTAAGGIPGRRLN